MKLTAHFQGGPEDPTTCAVASLQRTLRFPAFTGGRALIRTERVYRRVGESHDGHATYQFDREEIVHGG